MSDPFSMDICITMFSRPSNIAIQQMFAVLYTIVKTCSRGFIKLNNVRTGMLIMLPLIINLIPGPFSLNISALMLSLMYAQYAYTYADVSNENQA